MLSNPLSSEYYVSPSIEDKVFFDREGSYLNWGNKNEKPTPFLNPTDASDLTKLANWTFNFSLESIQQGNADSETIPNIIVQTFPHAVKGGFVGDASDWYANVFPDKVDLEKESKLYESLSEDDSDNNMFSTWKDFYSYVDIDGNQRFEEFARTDNVPSEVKESINHFYDLKSKSLDPKGTQSDPNKTLPFIYREDEAGTPYVEAALPHTLRKWSSLKDAINSAVDSGSIPKSAVPSIIENLNLQGGGITAQENIRKFEVGKELADTWQSVMVEQRELQKEFYNEAKERGEKNPFTVSSGDFQPEQTRFIQALNVIENSILYTDQAQDRAENPIKGWWKQDAGDYKSLTFLGSGSSVMEGMPLSKKRYSAEWEYERAAKTNNEILNDRKALANALRSGGMENVPDDVVIEQAFGMVASAMNASSMLKHYSSDENISKNIRKFTDSTIVATPQLMSNKALFEKAISQRPDLSEEDVNYLKEIRKTFRKNTANRDVRLLQNHARSGVLKKWEKLLEENIKSDEPIKDLGELLDVFVSDDDNYHELMGIVEGAWQGLWTIGMRQVHAGLSSLVGGLVYDLTGWELANKHSKYWYGQQQQIQQAVDADAQLAEIFGDNRDFRKVAVIGGTVALDLTGAAAAIKGATRIAGAALTRQLANQGWRISDKSFEKGLHHALLKKGDAASKIDIATFGLQKGAIAPVSGKLIWQNKSFVKALADDVSDISTRKLTRFTDKGVIAFGVGSPAGMRSGVSTYHALIESMPDYMTFEEKRSHALGGAFLSGLITGGITAGFQLIPFLGSGAESVLGKGAVKMSELTKTRHLTKAFQELKRVSGVRGASGQRVLIREVAEVANRFAREGLAKISASGLIGKTIQAAKPVFKGALWEGIEEGLDEFVNSYVQSANSPDEISLAERLSHAAFAGRMGMYLGGGIPAVVGTAKWGARKLGYGPDESYITEQLYEDAVDRVMTEVEQNNEAIQRAEMAGAPRTAEELERNRAELLAGFARNRVAPSAKYTLSLDTNVNFSGKDPNEVVVVNSNEITGVTISETPEGDKFYEVEFIPEGSSETRPLVAYTNDPSIEQANVRFKKLKRDLGTEELEKVVEVPLINVENQEEVLATTEGIDQATNTFVNSNEVALRNNGISVLTNPTDQQLMEAGFSDTIINRISSEEVVSEMNDSGNIVMIVNSSAVSDITKSMPKARRSNYVKQLYVEGFTTSLELASIRDKWANLEADVRGDLLDFVLADRLKIYGEMNPNERDRAAAALLGEDYKEGLSADVSEKALLASTHVRSLVQYELFGETTTEIQREAWRGKGRGGALSRAIKDKLFDILDYLRAASRVSTDTFRPLLREQINAIQEKATDFLIEQISSVPPEQMEAILEELEYDQMTNVRGEGSGGSGSRGRESDESEAKSAEAQATADYVETYLQRKRWEDTLEEEDTRESRMDVLRKSGFWWDQTSPRMREKNSNYKKYQKAFRQAKRNPEALEAPLKDVELWPFSRKKTFVRKIGDALLYRTEAGSLFLFEETTIDKASTKLSSGIAAEVRNIVPYKSEPEIVINPEGNDVMLITHLDETLVLLHENATESDLVLLREAQRQNPLFEEGLVDSDLSGQNVGFLVRPIIPSFIDEGTDLYTQRIYAVPLDFGLDGQLSESEQELIKAADPKGIPITKLSPALLDVIGIDPDVVKEFSDNQAQDINLDTQNSSINTPEDSSEPIPKQSPSLNQEDQQPADQSNNLSTRKQKRLARKLIASLQRKLRKEGTAFYEAEGTSAAWFDRSKMAIGYDPSQVAALARKYSPANAKAILYLAANEELDHQFSWESLSLDERNRAVKSLIQRDPLGHNALIGMAQEYGADAIPDLLATDLDTALSVLRMGLPEQNGLPEGVPENEINKARKEILENYLFEELLRKHVSLVTNGTAVETDYDWLKNPKNQGMLSVYRKYISNILIQKVRAQEQLRKDSRLTPMFRIAVNRVAQEHKAAREGFRRKLDPFKLDDPDLDLGIYSRQKTLISDSIETASEEEEREEWLTEIDPSEVKQSVISGQTVGTRSPTSKAKKGEGVKSENQVSLETLRENPQAYKKNALILLEFPIVAEGFDADPLTKRVEDLKAPVTKAQLKVESIKQDIAFDHRVLKQKIIEYKRKEKSDQLKPERKAIAVEAKAKFKEAAAKSTAIDKEIKKLDGAVKRGTAKVNEIIKKQVNSIKAKIKKAEQRGDVSLVKELNNRKEQVENIVSLESKQGEALQELQEKLLEAKERGRAFNQQAKRAAKDFDTALKEANTPKVLKSEVSVKGAGLIKIVDELSDAIQEGKPVRAGAKALVSKYNAIMKKAEALKKASLDATKKTKKYSDELKKISKSEKIFPIDKADEIYNHFVDSTKSNLENLIQLFPQDLRTFASLWYDGANRIANSFAKTYRVTVEQAAAVLGVNSPQKDWFMNVALAERIMKIWSSKQNAKFDGAMAANFMARAGEPSQILDKEGNVKWEGGAIPIYEEDGTHATDENGILLFDNWGSSKSQEQQAIAKHILNKGLRGKRLKDLKAIKFTIGENSYSYSKEELQARFVRMYSEQNDPKTFNVIRPDGVLLDRPSKSHTGNTRSLAWGSYPMIEKSINILKAPLSDLMPTISEQLGVQHKVRSFYNNIVDPANPDGHVTMDTHAVAALLWKALSGNSVEVSQNFGGRGTATDSSLGIRGLYPAFAEAYRSVRFINEDTGELYLPREIQSITWEAVRLLFPSTWKSNADNVRAINEIWQRFKNKVLTLKEAQEQVFLYVQKSKSIGVPDAELLNIQSAIESSETERGSGIGRPEWGQAAALPLDDDFSEQYQSTSMSWKVLDSKYQELAKDPDDNAVQLFELYREASKKAEARIPRVSGYMWSGALTDYTDKYVEIIKNPTLREVESFMADQRDMYLSTAYPMVLTASNKYLFSRQHTVHEFAARHLGLREYVGALVFKDKKTGETSVLVTDATTDPYRSTGLTAAIIKEHYGDDVEVNYFNEKPVNRVRISEDGGKTFKDADSSKPFRWEENRPEFHAVMYDLDEDVLPLSSRLRLKPDKQFTKIQETPPAWAAVLEDSKQMAPITRDELNEKYDLSGEEGEFTQRANTKKTYGKLFKGLIEAQIQESGVKDYNILDWGSGWGYGTDVLRSGVEDTLNSWENGEKPNVNVNSIEPYYNEDKGESPPTIIGKPEDNSQDLIVNSVVLNVLPESERVDMLNDIYNALKEGGSAIVTVRRERDVMNTATKVVVGPAEIVATNSQGQQTFQKGFTPESLKEFAGSVLPQALITKAPVKGLSPASILIEKPFPVGYNIEAEVVIEPDLELKQLIESIVPSDIIDGAYEQSWAPSFRRGGHWAIKRYLQKNWTGEEAIEAVEKVTGKPNSLKVVTGEREPNKTVIGGRSLNEFLRGWFVPYLSGFGREHKYGPITPTEFEPEVGPVDFMQFTRIKGDGKVSIDFWKDTRKSRKNLEKLGPLSTTPFKEKDKDMVEGFDTEFIKPINVQDIVPQFDRAFHFTKKYSDFLLAFKEPDFDTRSSKDFQFNKKSKSIGAFVIQELSDLAVSLPDIEGTDLQTGKTVDPLSIIKRHFKGGEKRPVSSVLKNLSDAVSSLPLQDQGWASADLKNLGELAIAIGADVSPEMLDLLVRREAEWRFRFNDDLNQYTKIRGDETFSEMNAAKQEATDKANEAITQASFGMDVERVMALFGPKMYDAKLSKVLVKEASQNSYDALKDLFEIDPTLEPEIEYGVWEYGSSEIDKKRAWNWGQTIKEKKHGAVAVPEELIEDTIKSLEKGDAFEDSQWFYVRDNGIGMNPEIIKNAFFTLGGSYKQSKKSSGGFGLAKIQMLHSAEEVFIKTVRDGVQTVVRVDHDTLMQQKDFDMVATEAPEGTPSGTQVWMRYPKEIDGQRVNLRTYSYYPDQNIYDDAFEIKINNDGEESTSININDFDQKYGFEKTVVNTPTADITVRALKLGKYDKDGEKIYSIDEKDSPWGKKIKNNKVKIYSNGLLQFEYTTPKIVPFDIFGDNLPYHFIVDVNPTVDPANIDYPFNNNREGFSPQWTGKKDDPLATSNNHPIEKAIGDVIEKYRKDYFNLTFSQEFDIIKGIDGSEPKPSVPVIYNNMDFDLDGDEISLMKEFSQIIFEISDKLLGVYKHDYFENDNSIGSRDYVPRAIRNSEKVAHQNNPTDFKDGKAVSYHYGSALSKNWGGVNTSKDPHLILVNPVYSSTLFDEKGNIRDDVGINGFADYVTDIIFHEVNHISQNNENSGFTYAFSAIKGYKPMLDPIFEESRQRISELVDNNYGTIKKLRQKFVKGSTKFLDAEIQGNGFINAFAEFDDVRGRQARSQGEAIKQNFGKNISDDEIQVTDGGITLLEAFSKRTFRPDEVNEDPTVQRTRITEQGTDYKSLVGKSVGGLYISAKAIEEGISKLEGTGKKAIADKERYATAKARLEDYLQAEKITAEKEGVKPVPFEYDVVVFEADQVRFVLLSNLLDPHPSVEESLRVPNDPEKPILRGRIHKDKDMRPIYHRVETILGPSYGDLYKYHAAITKLEDDLGILNKPSGNQATWKQQMKKAGVSYGRLQSMHNEIRDQFFPQKTRISEDPTSMPEYTDVVEAWDMVTSLLNSDIPVLDSKEDSLVARMAKRLLFKKGSDNWNEATNFGKLFLGALERNLRKYDNKARFIKESITKLALDYKATLDRILDNEYVSKGVAVPSQMIMDATGSTDLTAPYEIKVEIDKEYTDSIERIESDSGLSKEEKEEAKLEAINARDASLSGANKAAMQEARAKQSEALTFLKNEAPELFKHVMSLRSLADNISNEIAGLVGVQSPEVNLIIKNNLQIYLTKQYKVFSQGADWTEEFLNDEKHDTAREIALDFFASVFVDQRVEEWTKNGGLSKEAAKAEAELVLKNNPQIKRDVLEHFIRSYEKDNSVDSLQRKGALPEGMRLALGEYEADANFDVILRTIMNLGQLASSIALKNDIIAEGRKAGWLLTTKEFNEAKGLYEADTNPDKGPFKYANYEQVVKGNDTTESKSVHSMGETPHLGGLDIDVPHSVSFNPDGTPSVGGTKKRPSADPFLNYRMKTEDGSVEQHAAMMAPKEIAKHIRDVLNPNITKTKDAEDSNILMRGAENLHTIFGPVEEKAARGVGWSQLLKTAGSVAYYPRDVIGGFIFLKQNGIPAGSLFRNMAREIPRSMFPAGWEEGAGVLSNVQRSAMKNSADRENPAYYARLRALNVLDKGISYSILQDLLSGKTTEQEVLEEINKTQELEKQGVEEKPDPNNKFHDAAVQIAKGAGKLVGVTASYGSNKAQGLILALDNSVKVTAFEYERDTLVEAREDSLEDNRYDQFRDMTDDQIDEMAADIIQRTQQNKDQAMPIVNMLTRTPYFRVLAAPFARFMGESPRLLVNVPRQAAAEKNHENPVIKRRGQERLRGWWTWNFILYGALMKGIQWGLTGLGEDDDREFRKGSPEWSRVQNYLYLRDKSGKLNQMSLSYLHPMSPVLDAGLRSMSSIFAGEPYEALRDVTYDFLFNSFLNEQIVSSAVRDVINNEDRNSGEAIFPSNQSMMEKVGTGAWYIIDKGFMPPSAHFGWKAIKAGGSDYERGPNARAFLGEPYYSPLGIFGRHAAPFKFYPVNIEGNARRRFKELKGKLDETLNFKGKWRDPAKGFKQPEVSKRIRDEIDETETGLREARRAYLTYRKYIPEFTLQEMLKGAQYRSSLVEMIQTGYMDTSLLIESAQSSIDQLMENFKFERATWIRDAYIQEGYRRGLVDINPD